MKNSKIAKLKAERAKQYRLDNQQQKDGIKAAIDALYELINGKEVIERRVTVEYDWDKLIKQIEAIKPVINVELEEVKKAIEAIKLPDSIEIKDINDLIQAVEKNKPLPAVFDTKPIVKAIVQLEQRIQDQTVEESQSAEDYKPFRRVIKAGNRLLYDDQPTPSRGGGGSSSSGGLTDTELRATAVPVSSTTLATAANQANIITDTGTIAGDTTSLDNKTPDQEGTWGYRAGTNGTLTISGSKRVLQITAIALGAAGSFTIKRIALHDDTAANVTTSSTTLVGGVDGQALTKTSDFSLALTLKLTYTNA